MQESTVISLSCGLVCLRAGLRVRVVFVCLLPERYFGRMLRDGVVFRRYCLFDEIESALFF